MKSPIQSFTIQSCSFHRSSFRHSAETEEKCCNLSSIKKSSEASRVIGANGNFRPIHENFIRLWLGFNGVIWGYCWDFFLFLCFLFDGFLFLWFFFFFFTRDGKRKSDCEILCVPEREIEKLSYSWENMDLWEDVKSNGSMIKELDSYYYAIYAIFLWIPFIVYLN